MPVIKAIRREEESHPLNLSGCFLDNRGRRRKGGGGEEKVGEEGEVLSHRTLLCQKDDIPWVH